MIVVYQEMVTTDDLEILSYIHLSDELLQTTPFVLGIYIKDFH